MKRFLLSAIFLFALMLGANAQKVEKQNTTEVSSQAEITFDKLEHDYGEVKQNGNGVCEFKYTNTGSVPLVLSKVRSSCGCTVPKWSKEPLMPGQSATITVKYNTSSVGPINKSITVESNAKTPRVRLLIKGKVIK
jgi:archaellum component FlaF (FlaF/FlaG flagellin family)